MQKRQAGNTAYFCMQANPRNAFNPYGAFRGFVSMQRCDACYFSHFCICHDHKLRYSSLYGYHRKGTSANAWVSTRVRTAPRPSVIQRPLGYWALPTGSTTHHRTRYVMAFRPLYLHWRSAFPYFCCLRAPNALVCGSNVAPLSVWLWFRPSRFGGPTERPCQVLHLVCAIPL